MANKTDIKNTTEETHDITLQENVSPRNNLTRQGSAKQQVRHRASVACAACRERRIRCVVPKGDRECTQCKRTGTECIIKNDDERRRYVFGSVIIRYFISFFFSSFLKITTTLY